MLGPLLAFLPPLPTFLTLHVIPSYSPHSNLWYYMVVITAIFCHTFIMYPNEQLVDWHCFIRGNVNFILKFICLIVLEYCDCFIL